MIEQNARNLLAKLPTGVDIVAAAKTRSANEVREAIDGGVGIVGHNYVQEAQVMIGQLGRAASADLAAGVQGVHVGQMAVAVLRVVLVFQPFLELAETADPVGWDALARLRKRVAEFDIDIQNPYRN